MCAYRTGPWKSKDPRAHGATNGGRIARHTAFALGDYRREITWTVGECRRCQAGRRPLATQVEWSCCGAPSSACCDRYIETLPTVFVKRIRSEAAILILGVPAAISPVSWPAKADHPRLYLAWATEKREWPTFAGHDTGRNPPASQQIENCWQRGGIQACRLPGMQHPRAYSTRGKMVSFVTGKSGRPPGSPNSSGTASTVMAGQRHGGPSSGEGRPSTTHFSAMPQRRG